MEVDKVLRGLITAMAVTWACKFVWPQRQRLVLAVHRITLLYLLIFSSVRRPKLQGATVKRDKSTGAIVVARIMRGGAADKSGELISPWTDCADCVVTRRRKSAQA